MLSSDFHGNELSSWDQEFKLLQQSWCSYLNKEKQQKFPLLSLAKRLSFSLGKEVLALKKHNSIIAKNCYDSKMLNSYEKSLVHWVRSLTVKFNSMLSSYRNLYRNVLGTKIIHSLIVEKDKISYRDLSIESAQSFAKARNNYVSNINSLLLEAQQLANRCDGNSLEMDYTIVAQTNHEAIVNAIGKSYLQSTSSWLHRELRTLFKYHGVIDSIAKCSKLNKLSLSSKN